MAPTLKIINGERSGESIAIADGPTTIGRGDENSIVIKNSSVSRRHCLIEHDGDALLVSDLGSLNGTFVNGAPANATRIDHGDELRVGDIRFGFSDRERADSPSSVAIERTEFGLPHDSVRIRIDDLFGTMARDLTAIRRIATKITSAHVVGTLERELLELLMEVVPADSAAVVSIDDSNEIIRTTAINRSEPGAEVAVSGSIIDQALRERAVLLIPEIETATATESLVAARTRSLIVVPITVFDRTLGAIYLSSTKTAFNEDVVGFLTAAAAIGGAAIENARAWTALADENERLRGETFSRHMLGESDAMQKVFTIIRKVAPSDSTVLIDGESGTGKELAAQSVHLNSKRRAKPFVAVNCAALTESLLESELFGHEKGAFTGAVAMKPGRIESAAGGTLFLDEIGEMDIRLQAKLLRVLQEREFERVGGTRKIRADIRLIAATNRDLEKEVAEGRFREDLFYRLNVVRFTMPALRDRREDIPVLSAYFVRKYGEKMNRRLRGVSASAAKLLSKHDFPGNVRELENAIERAVVLGSGEWIGPEDLPHNIAEPNRRQTPESVSYHDAILETKRRLILDAFRKSGGSYVETAKILEVHPNYLHRLIRNLELKDEISDL